MPLKLALTADLHWGHNARGDEAVRLLAEALHRSPPDVLVLAGDIGTVRHFAGCLEVFADLPCRKALVPGNHDVWVPRDAEHDSLHLYETELPRISAQYGFHYLDQAPLVLDEGLALVGSMSWYDYSWSLAELQQRFPGEEEKLKTKHFPFGTYMDAVYVRWPYDDVTFTTRAAAALEQHLTQVLRSSERAVVVTHHPCFQGVSFPSVGRAETLTELFWAALGGSVQIEQVLARHADRIAFAFSGHTHRSREGSLGPIRGFNIGGDYRWKRLLRLDWPEGTVTPQEFGTPDAL